ncbi:MAG: TPM domain-containing protein [Rhodanobacter sp.]
MMHVHTLRAKFAFILLLFALFSWPLAARDQTPQPSGPVTDLAQVLSAPDALRIARLLLSYQRETSHQIAVLTTPSLGGEPIEVYSRRMAKAWGLGQAGVDNGILIVLAPQDRRVRIELGRGFERYVSNARAAEIVAQDMQPFFKERDYAQGLEHGIRQLMDDGRHFVVPR